jgi:hypothetical protein
MAEIHEYLKIKWPLCAEVGMKERGSFVDPSQMRMGSCHACKGTGKVWALDQQEMAARIAALEAEVKAYELQDGMLRKAYEDSGDAGRFTWSGWLLNLVRDNAALEAEVQALREKLTQRSAPVSDEDFPHLSYLIYPMPDGYTGPVLSVVDDVNALIAARAAQPKEEPNAK